MCHVKFLTSVTEGATCKSSFTRPCIAWALVYNLKILAHEVLVKKMCYRCRAFTVKIHPISLCARKGNVGIFFSVQNCPQNKQQKARDK